jgi:transcriptional regulator with XRE-family HTH domain
MDEGLAVRGMEQRRAFALEVGRRIGAARDARGMTMVELARLAGMDQGQISRTERGEFTPDLFTVARMTKALGVPFSKLIDGAMPVWRRRGRAERSGAGEAQVAARGRPPK